jgi:WXG100 family type VII secretion target
MSTDAEIVVIHAALDKAASDANQTAQFMNTQFTHLKDELNRLNVWDGPAAQTYKKLQGEWDDAADAMRKILADISQLVNDINKYYRDAETGLENSWQG